MKKGIDELNKKKYSEFFYVTENEERAGWTRSTMSLEQDTKQKKDEIYEVLPGVLFYGEVKAYYKFAQKQSEKSQKQLFEEYRNNVREEPWNFVEEIFDLRENASVPTYIENLADSSQSYGVRVITEVKTKEKTVKTKSKGFLKKKTKEKSSTVTEQRREYVEDKNVTRTQYRFSNNFSFTVNRSSAIQVCDTDSLSSILKCLEGSTINQKAILIQSGPYSMAIVIGYLVHLRKWSIRRAFKFVFKRLPRDLVTQYSATLIEPVLFFLEFEKITLPHVYPSIPFRIIPLFHLHMVCINFILKF